MVKNKCKCCFRFTSVSLTPNASVRHRPLIFQPTPHKTTATAHIQIFHVDIVVYWQTPDLAYRKTDTGLQHSAKVWGSGSAEGVEEAGLRGGRKGTGNLRNRRSNKTREGKAVAAAQRWGDVAYRFLAKRNLLSPNFTRPRPKSNWKETSTNLYSVPARELSKKTLGNSHLSDTREHISKNIYYVCVIQNIHYKNTRSVLKVTGPGVTCELWTKERWYIDVYHLTWYLRGM